MVFSNIGYIIMSITMYGIALVYKYRSRQTPNDTTIKTVTPSPTDTLQTHKHANIARLKKAILLDEYITNNISIRDLKMYFRIYNGMHTIHGRSEIVCYICRGKYNPKVWDGLAAREFIYKHCVCIKRNT